MADEKNDLTSVQQLIFSLTEAKQKEIDAVRNRMEEFLKGQLDLQHKMELVANKQDALKERFEEGVSKRLNNLDGKIDLLLIKEGERKKDDELRDERMKDVKEKADGADRKADAAIESAQFYGKWILTSVLGGLALGGLLFIFQRFHG